MTSRRSTVLIGTVALIGISLATLQPRRAEAYKTWHDDAPVHESLAEYALGLYDDPEPPNTEPWGYWLLAGDPNPGQPRSPSLKAGTADEDAHDHVYGYGDIKGTMPHFWDADKGPDDDVVIVTYTTPNAWEKARSLWSHALGLYAIGAKEAAYDRLGHVAHLIMDQSVPAHAHEDCHAFPCATDTYEEWMKAPSSYQLTSDELAALALKGPVQIPATEPAITGDLCGGCSQKVGSPWKLYWLMYTTNQLGDAFPSDDGAGDVNDPLGWSTLELNGVDDDGSLSTRRDYSYFRAIRAVASVYRLFQETTSSEILTVRIERAAEVWGGWWDPGNGPPDFFSKVWIGGNYYRVAPTKDARTIYPSDWAFGSDTASASDPLKVNIEVWDDDSGISGADEKADISPLSGSTLELDIDLAACLAGDPGAVSYSRTLAPVGAGTCGVPIKVRGTDKDTELTFTISMKPAIPPTDTTLSIHAPREVAKDATAGIAGVLSSADTACMAAQQVSLRKGATTLQTKTTSDAGGYRFRQKIRRTTTVHVTYAGTTTCAPSRSIDKTIRVR